MDNTDYQMIIERMDKHYDALLNKTEDVLKQATRTNGRVNALEDRMDHTEESLKMLTETHHKQSGALKVIYIVAGAIGSLLIYFISMFGKFIKFV